MLSLFYQHPEAEAEADPQPPLLPAPATAVRTNPAMQKHIESRQKLEAQLQENLIVEDEFKSVKDDAKVHKLTGPVLVPQSIDEAKSNVEKRLEFIRGQISTVEEEVASLQKQAEDKRDQVS